MDEQIKTKLSELEEKHDVRILFSCESGSRAWGFASSNSDYDVRFVYVHPIEWYLHLDQQRDTIEAMLPNDLDLSGWELRKTLRLFGSCNLALNEWLGSPIIYSDDGQLKTWLYEFIPEYFNFSIK